MPSEETFLLQECKKDAPPITRQAFDNGTWKARPGDIVTGLDCEGFPG
ncbi:MAG: hypothetical protein H7Z75_14240 [Ferruginibacter sp.]|nr:hypothetical protein [Cytophagales bacterium]